MGAHGAVGDGPLSLLLHRVVGERLAKAVLAEPHSLWDPVLESDHVVLPVADVIADHHTEDGVAEVERVEVHIVGVHKTGAMIVDNDSAAARAVCLAGAIGFNTVEPGGVCRDIVDGGEVDFVATRRKGVEVVHIIER